MSRVFVDTGVLIRYFAEDDPPRALAAARLIDSDTTLVLSTGVLIELVHALRTQHGMANPAIGNALIRFLSRPNIELSDASRGQVIAALMWSLSTSARRIPDAIIAKAAEASRVDYIATFDERMSSPAVPIRLI